MPARITGAFAVREVPGLSRGGRCCVELLEPLEYRVGHADADEAIVVPAGFLTDFASIPRGLWNLFPPMGPWSRAAIVHDFLYATKGTGAWQGRRWINRIGRYRRPEADAIFHEAMGVVDPAVNRWARGLMYAAVRIGGAGGWGR
jgi:hypothetical protein